MIDPALVFETAVEPFDNDAAWRGQPVAAAIGQYYAIFYIHQQLVTTPVDVVPGAEGLTLGTDWLNDNVSTWDLDTGKVNTYTGSFQTRMEKEVQMLRATTKKKSPTHVLMETPVFSARKKRMAAGHEAPELPPELTQLSPMEEFLEFPPAVWDENYVFEPEGMPEAEPCTLIPPEAWARMRSPDTPLLGMQTDASPSVSTHRVLIQ